MKISQRNIIIIGAGIAGLSAAFKLIEKGIQVTILEARPTSGGRIQTFIEQFSDGLFAEGGAYYVSDHHRETMKYIKEVCKLPLSPILSEREKLFYYLKNEKDPLITIDLQRGLGEAAKNIPGAVLVQNPWPSSLTLNSDEQNKGLYGFLKEYFVPKGIELSREATLHANNIPTEIKQYDEMNFLHYLKTKARASGGAIKLLEPWLVPYLDQYENVSALAILRDAKLARNFDTPDVKWFTLERGMAEFPHTLANQLPEKTIRYNAEVTQLDQDEKGVTVFYKESGETRSIKANRIICTLPLPILREIKFHPPLSSMKRRIIEEFSYASIMRIYIECETKSYRRDGWNGHVFSDLGFNLIDSTHHLNGINGSQKGILQYVTSGANAIKLGGKSEEERINFAVTQMDKIFPGIKNSFNKSGSRGISKFWDEDKWNRGAYVLFKPGQITEFGSDIFKHEGLIYFAGDHTSEIPGWMEGAIQSAHRVVEEIVG